MITHNTVGVLQSSLPSAGDYPQYKTVGVLQSSLPSAGDYPQYCGGFTMQFASAGDYPQYCGGFTQAVCPLLVITNNTLGVLQSSLPSAGDYPQYCGGVTKQFALCW